MQDPIHALTELNRNQRDAPDRFNILIQPEDNASVTAISENTYHTNQLSTTCNLDLQLWLEIYATAETVSKQHCSRY